MDELRQGIGLRSYAQNNPLTEYQTEGYDRFQEMIATIDYDVTRIVMKSEIRQNLQRQSVGQGSNIMPTRETVASQTGATGTSAQSPDRRNENAKTDGNPKSQTSG